MPNNSKIISFTATANPEKAKAFYQDVLALKLVNDDPTAIVFDSNGTMLRVSKVKDLRPQPFTILGWQVGNIEERIRDLVSKGAKFEIFDGFGQDELGIWTTPDGTKIAWFKDPDGNLLSLTQFIQ